MLLALAKLSVDQLVPSAGVSGYLLLVEQLQRIGIARGTATATLLISFLTYYAAYASLAVVVLIILWFHRDATVRRRCIFSGCRSRERWPER